MRTALRRLALTIGGFLLIGSSAALAQRPPAYYYPAPGYYATTRGTIAIPAAGYYYDVPLAAQRIAYTPYYPTQTNASQGFSGYRVAGGGDPYDDSWQFRGR